MLGAYAGGLFPSQKHAGEGHDQGKGYGKAVVNFFTPTYKERYWRDTRKTKPSGWPGSKGLSLITSYVLHQAVQSCLCADHLAAKDRPPEGR